MSPIEILALILMAVGAIINFLVPVIIRKKLSHSDSSQNLIYITKSIGLVIVITGCIIFFLLGGKFGV